MRILDQELLRMCNGHVLALELGLQLGHTPWVRGQDDGATISHLHRVLGEFLSARIPILLGRGGISSVLQGTDAVVPGSFIEIIALARGWLNILALIWVHIDKLLLEASIALLFKVLGVFVGSFALCGVLSSHNIILQLLNDSNLGSSQGLIVRQIGETTRILEL
jgi:hypothetical protein